LTELEVAVKNSLKEHLCPFPFQKKTAFLDKTSLPLECLSFEEFIQDGLDVISLLRDVLTTL